MIFEGTEKKFELILTHDHPSLRKKFSKNYWNEIVKISQASILSQISNSKCDAYLLSESSLFVYDQKVIMITCGETLLIEALLKLISDIPKSSIYSLFYERKNENFPHLQLTQFEDDVKKLEKTIPGKTKVFGNSDGHHVSIFYIEHEQKAPPNDQTLEILMYDIDKKIKNLFHAQTMKNTSEIKEKTDIHLTLPGFQFDDYLFLPSGYSLNALNDEFYFTYHITPNDIGSYVSFETNFAFQTSEDISLLTQKIVNFFQPKRFDLIYFKEFQNLNHSFIKNYSSQLNERFQLQCGYEVSFHHYTQKTYIMSHNKSLKDSPIEEEETDTPSLAKRRSFK